MKAKVIATGEIVNVGYELFDYDRGTNVYKEINVKKDPDELKYFDEKQLFFIQQEFIDWENRRFELVKAMLPQAAVFANDSLIETGNDKTDVFDAAAVVAIKFADAVIARLKGE